MTMDDDNRDAECEKCGQTMHVEWDLEPTALCNLCAQEIAEPIWAAQRAGSVTPNAEFTGGPLGPSGGMPGSAPTKGD